MNKQLFNGAICILGFLVPMVLFLWLMPDSASVVNLTKRLAYVYSGFLSIFIYLEKVNVALTLFLETLLKSCIVWVVWRTANKPKWISFTTLAFALLYGGIGSYFGATLIVAMLQ